MVSGGEYRIQPPWKVVVTEKKLELTEKVYFDTGKATIKTAEGREKNRRVEFMITNH